MTGSRIDKLLAEAMAHPSNALRLIEAATRSHPHLDDEDIAALADGSARESAIVHAVRCRACAARLEAVADILGIHPIHAADAPALALDAPSPLFAAIAQRPDGGLRILATSGPRRTSAALQVRRRGAASAPDLAVGLRDAAAPTWELALRPSGDTSRVSLSATWLDDAHTPDALRVTAAGRVLAETPFAGGRAALERLRPDCWRIEAVRDARALAVAWIRWETEA